MAWRDRHIKHLVLAAPVPAGGFTKAMQNFASRSTLLFVPGVDPLALTLRLMWRTFESAIVNFSSPAVFGRRSLVITRERNYSAPDMEDFLAATGYGAAVEPFRRREVPKMDYFQAPIC